jgi:hypothetical protein
MLQANFFVHKCAKKALNSIDKNASERRVSIGAFNTSFQMYKFIILTGNPVK